MNVNIYLRDTLLTKFTVYFRDFIHLKCSQPICLTWTSGFMCRKNFTVCNFKFSWEADNNSRGAVFILCTSKPPQCTTPRVEWNTASNSACEKSYMHVIRLQNSAVDTVPEKYQNCLHSNLKITLIYSKIQHLSTDICQPGSTIAITEVDRLFFI